LIVFLLVLFIVFVVPGPCPWPFVFVVLILIMPRFCARSLVVLILIFVVVSARSGTWTILIVVFIPVIVVLPGPASGSIVVIVIFIVIVVLAPAAGADRGAIVHFLRVGLIDSPVAARLGLRFLVEDFEAVAVGRGGFLRNWGRAGGLGGGDGDLLAALSAGDRLLRDVFVNYCGCPAFGTNGANGHGKNLVRMVGEIICPCYGSRAVASR
jgi:hypothetical protein